MELERFGGRLPPPSEAAPASVFAGETATTTTLITMPQDRNLHGKVFGGLLMRKAFETAFACGWRLTGVLPKFLALDDVTFLQPVETGALLRFDARVTYARGKTYGVSVSARMQSPTPAWAAAQRSARAGDAAAAIASAGGSALVTPTAVSTPASSSSSGNSSVASSASSSSSAAAAASDGAQQLTNEFHFVFYCDDPSFVPAVYPRTYAEAMAYINAHRRLEIGQSLAERRKKDGVRVRFG
jgi:acyl-CoA hydrolase